MLLQNLESFIVGGRDTKGPGLSAGDMSLPRDLHHRWITPFIVQSGSEISMTSLHHFGNDPHQCTIL